MAIPIYTCSTTVLCDILLCGNVYPIFCTSNEHFILQIKLYHNKHKSVRQVCYPYRSQLLAAKAQSGIEDPTGFLPFPLHPHHSMRGSCGALLLKTVELAGGRTYLYPFLSYCYIGLDQSLQLLLDQPDFYNQCEQWRLRRPRDGMFYDVYDGEVWRVSVL